MRLASLLPVLLVPSMIPSHHSPSGRCAYFALRGDVVHIARAFSICR
jgi:hypothetical protein